MTTPMTTTTAKLDILNRIRDHKCVVLDFKRNRLVRLKELFDKTEGGAPSQFELVDAEVEIANAEIEVEEVNLRILSLNDHDLPK